MAVAENAGAKIDSSNHNLDNSVVSSDTSEMEKSTLRNISINSDQNMNGVFNHNDKVLITVSVPNSNYKAQMGQMRNGFEGNEVQNQQMVVNNNGYGVNGENEGESFKRDMRDLEELLSKLNLMAEQFVPPSLTNNHGYLARASTRNL